MRLGNFLLRSRLKHDRRQQPTILIEELDLGVACRQYRVVPLAAELLTGKTAVTQQEGADYWTGRPQFCEGSSQNLMNQIRSSACIHNAASVMW